MGRTASLISEASWYITENPQAHVVVAAANVQYGTHILTEIWKRVAGPGFLYTPHGIRTNDGGSVSLATRSEDLLGRKIDLFLEDNYAVDPEVVKEGKFRESLILSNVVDEKELGFWTALGTTGIAAIVIIILGKLLEGAL